MSLPTFPFRRKCWLHKTLPTNCRFNATLQFLCTSWVSYFFVLILILRMFLFQKIFAHLCSPIHLGYPVTQHRLLPNTKTPPCLLGQSRWPKNDVEPLWTVRCDLYGRQYWLALNIHQYQSQEPTSAPSVHRRFSLTLSVADFSPWHSISFSIRLISPFPHRHPSIGRPSWSRVPIFSTAQYSAFTSPTLVDTITISLLHKNSCSPDLTLAFPVQLRRHPPTPADIITTLNSQALPIRLYLFSSCYSLWPRARFPFLLSLWLYIT